MLTSAAASKAPSMSCGQQQRQRTGHGRGGTSRPVVAAASCAPRTRSSRLVEGAAGTEGTEASQQPATCRQWRVGLQCRARLGCTSLESGMGAPPRVRTSQSCKCTQQQGAVGGTYCNESRYHPRLSSTHIPPIDGDRKRIPERLYRLGKQAKQEQQAKQAARRMERTGRPDE